MNKPTRADFQLDNSCFQQALYEWNVGKTGSDNTALHLAWWKLSQAERSEVMQIAQQLKRDYLELQEEKPPCRS